MWHQVEEAAGEVIVGYESLNPEGGVVAGEVADGVVALRLSLGPGVTRATGSTYNTRGWNTGPVPLQDAYIEWGWSGSSRPIDLERLDLRYDRSSSGPRQLDIHLAINDLPFEPIFCDPEVSELGEDQIGIDLTDFDSVESATFRLYAYSAESLSGTFDLENFSTMPNQAVLVSGNVSSVPEPSTLSMMIAAAAGFGFVRSAKRLRHRDSAGMCLAVNA
jgi:hypothetical protein